jgi:hypothetical protein
LRIPRGSDRELTTAGGAVIIGPNQLALLLGLVDRPGYQAESSQDMLNAAMPYMWLFRSASHHALKKSLRRLNSAWVSRRREGRRTVWQLTERGIGIVERTVPAHLMGHGAYQGVAVLRAGSLEENRRQALAWKWRRAIIESGMAPIFTLADAMVSAWRASTRAVGMAESLRKHHELYVLENYVRTYVLEHGKLPTGRRALNGSGMVVDFDELLRSCQGGGDGSRGSS